MKSIKSFLFIMALCIFSASCSKYVEKDVPDQFTDPSFWSGEDNVKAYSWEFYNLFTGFGTGTTGDFYFSTFTDDQASPGFQNYAVSAPTTSSAWNWTYIRKANIMLERIDQVPMSDEAKNHWKGVARFFRAYDYFNKVKAFGDVPWIGKSLDISETDKIYKPRDPRALVMDSIMADIDFAVNNLRTTTDNTVGKNVALALKSRIGLYEGSYRKYHTELNLPDADKFLQASKEASEQLMNAGYILDVNYRAVYSSMDLAGNKEVILYKKYLAGVLTHSVIGYTNSTTQMSGLTKSAVESYVMTDGLPIGQSPLYQGDNSIQDIRANRDGRLLLTIDTALMYNGHLVNGMSASTGYRPTKFLQPASNQLAPYNETDAPIFWLPEILLNYAEASTILQDMGLYNVTQDDLDKSVNLLRARAGVASLEIVGGNVLASGVIINDPKRDADVPSLTWEIRRERRVELMMDGFRYDDLMRWKKGPYMDYTLNADAYLGAKVPSNGSVTLNPDGYIVPYSASNIAKRVFIDPKHYLSPIPTGQISLYPDGTLTQNPGWE
ncbi:MAG TPA: RagB/SusD family nutrient uptake outer membrane protein [Chitinophagaceae bacterium]|nr:RagB/SusD family nutrient uptake outer membrane protein [Chitinophagaceae bacterium]